MGNKRVPEIRFPGFTDDWEQRKLGDLGNLKNGMNFGKDAMGHGFPFVNLQDIFGKNVVDDSNLDFAESSKKQRSDYNLLEGDVLFIRSSVKPEGVGEAALVRKSLKDTTYSGFLIRFRSNEEFDDNFKRYIFGAKSARNYIMAHATRSANTNINQNSLGKMVINLPNLREQRKIGDFFRQLDNTIALHQQELETLKQTKQGFLQKMFPKDGARNPEVRFKGLSRTWVSTRLGDIVDITKGSQKNRSTLSEIMTSNSPYPVYNGGVDISGYTDEYNRESLITISEGGASAGHVNFVPGKFWSGGHNYTLDVVNNDVDFIKSYLDFKQKRLYTLKVGSGLPNIQRTALEGFKITIPSLEEQQKIGNFFKQLDETIVIQEQELEVLIQTKKAFLQKMFI